MNQRSLIYIMGSSYSGSTLLTRLLAGHPKIATVGELKATSMGDIASYRCSCGALLNDCAFWIRVAGMMHDKGRQFSFEHFGTHFRADSSITDHLLRATIRGPLFETLRETLFLFSCSARRSRQEIIAQNQAIIEIICTTQEAELFLDDSKDPIRLKFLRDSGHWNAQVIYLLRDGRGVTNSYMRHHNTTMNVAAKEWIHTQKECDRLARQFDDSRCLNVHYEELCLNPAETLKKIQHFIGVEANNSSEVQHILGNQMRLDSLDVIKLDEKWRQALSPNDLQIFETLAGSLNRTYGYC